jgi:hypothetical protein
MSDLPDFDAFDLAATRLVALSERLLDLADEPPERSRADQLALEDALRSEALTARSIALAVLEACPPPSGDGRGAAEEVQPR